MEQLVQKKVAELKLPSNTKVTKLMLLNLEKKDVLYALNIESPAEFALDTWNVWRSATSLIEPNDVSTDQMMQINSGTSQVVIQSDGTNLLYANLDRAA